MVLPETFEVDEAPLDIRLHQRHAYVIADVETFETMDQLALGRRRQDAHPSAFARGAGHDSVERFADARCQEQCSRGFSQLPLDLRGVVLLRAAVSCQSAELRSGIDGRAAVQCGL